MPAEIEALLNQRPDIVQAFVVAAGLFILAYQSLAALLQLLVRNLHGLFGCRR